MLRRMLYILLLALLPLTSAVAAYVKVDYDYKGATMAEAAYEALAKAENLNVNSLSEILDHYTSAEVASAGIWLSKFLERRAIKDAGIFSSEENHYYKVILFMVEKRIIPRILRVGKELLNYPEKFIYWGPYLFRVCEDTMNLCMQFELVVTNGKKTFSGVKFVSLNSDLKQYFDLSKLGNVNWEEMWDNLTNIQAPSWEDFREDFKVLFDKVSPVNIAVAGGENIRGRATGLFDKYFEKGPESIPDLFNRFEEAYREVSSGAAVKNIMEGVIGDLKDSLAYQRLFNLSDYNLGNYITDYVNQLQGTFYTQRWYIYYEESGPVSGEEVVFKYYPDTNLDNWDYLNRLYGWTPIHVSGWDYSPTASDLASVKQNTDAYTGWSQSRVNSLNRSDPLYDYTIEYSLCQSRNIGWHYGGFIAYAYSTVVKRHPKPSSLSHEVYEDMFDSRVNNEVVFTKEFERRIESLNKNQEDEDPVNRRTYKIGKGEKHYYQLASEETVRNAGTASFTVSCNDEVELASGGFNFKVNEHYHADQMNKYAYPPGMIQPKKEEDTSGLTAKMDKFQSDIESNEQTIENYLSQIDDLQAIRDTTTNTASQRRLDSQISNLRLSIRGLENRNASLQDSINTYQNVLDEYAVDYNEDLDGPYRIPTLENDLARDFRLSWDGDGSWSGHTYTRYGHIVGMENGVKFVAEVKEERGESWFWFIRYHRAIVGVEYKLVSEYTTSDIVDVLQLTGTDRENADAVNKRRSEIQSEYPSCQVDVTYSMKDPPEKDTPEEAFHLLWMSDRVALARFIEWRLRQIDGKLAFIERNLLAQKSVLEDYKKAFFSGVPRWRSSSRTGAALQRWLENGNSCLIRIE